MGGEGEEFADRSAAIAAILATCEPGDVVTIHEEDCAVLLALEAGDEVDPNDLDECACPVFVASEHRA